MSYKSDTPTGEMARLIDEVASLTRELAEARADLQFVERWANHHGAKPSCTAEEALSVIQHYPPIQAITESYEDGKVPDTRNPWAELAAVTEERDALAAAIKLKEEQFDALLESRRNVAQDRKDAVERAEKAEAECERLRMESERLCSLIDATEINADHFTWRRSPRSSAQAIREEMDAIFGLKESK